MSGRRARVLAIAMFMGAALCCLKFVFRIVTAASMNPMVVIMPLVEDVFLVVVLILGARIVWEKGGPSGKVMLTDLE